MTYTTTISDFNAGTFVFTTTSQPVDVTYLFSDFVTLTD
jgi:hypothetical protein